MALGNFDEQTKFLIELKTNQFKRNSLSTLTYKQVENTLENTKWKDGKPSHLCYIAQDINTLTIDEVIEYLTQRQFSDQ